MTPHGTTDATGRALRAGAVRFEANYRLCAILEPDGTVRSVSEVVGVEHWDPSLFVGRLIWEIGVESALGDERAAVWQRRLAAARAHPGPMHYLDRRPDRSADAASTVDSMLIPVADASGVVESIVLHVHDQSEALEVVDRLRESEEQFRVLAESLPQMVWVTDDHGVARYFSPRWSAFTGRTVEDLMQRGYLDLIHPDDHPLLSRPRRSPRPVDAAQLEFRLRRHDGEFRWVEAQIRAVTDRSGRITEWVGGTIDISERREGDDLAREHQAQLETALAVSGLGRYAVYLRERRFDADERYCEIIGTDAQELMTRGGLEAFIPMIHTDDRGDVLAALQAAMDGGPDYAIEYRVWRPGREVPELRWVSAVGRLESDAEGPFRILGVLEDITDQRRHDDDRMRAQKREAIGTLAGGIAHDFNNVITAILSNASVAQHELAAGDSPETSIHEIARGARRAGDMVKRLLSFSREETPVRDPFDLGAVVAEACALLRPTLGDGVALQPRIAPSLPRVLGDSTQLHQVVMNLVTNAAQALGADGGGGTIAVSVERMASPQRGSGRSTPLPPGDYLRLCVTDDGPGIPEPLRERVFDPFFTTKPAGHGTGLGLAAAQSIIRNHGGTIAIDGAHLPGTSVVVHLPATGRRAAGEADPRIAAMPASPEPATRVVRVLFVDDEAPLVRLAERALPSQGCVAAAFDDPARALAAFQRDPAAFDCLVTDLSMPGMSGLELIRAVRARRPAIPVVLTSGFLTPACRDEADALRVDAIVPKPCAIDELAATVLRLVAGASPEIGAR